MTIFSLCRDQLVEHGPLPVDRLARAALDGGATRSQNPENAVRSALAYKAVELPDGRWALPTQLLEGCILTTRQGQPEEWPYAYAWSPRHDLAPLMYALRAGPIPLASGGVLTLPRYGGYGARPDGWPDVRGADEQLLALRLEGGVLHIDGVNETAHLRDRGSQLALSLGTLQEREGYFSTSVHAVVERLLTRLWALLADGPAMLSQPVPPLSECVPPLRVALRAEREARQAEAQVWRPQLTLPAELQDIAIAAARAEDGLFIDWLNGFVASSLRALPAEDEWERDYDWVRPLLRGV